MADDPNEPALRGTVHSFSEGFGYIVGEDGLLYSIHIGGLDVNLRYAARDEPLAAGDLIEFNAREGPDCLVAIDVRRAMKGTAAVEKEP